jgi:hypothetical protein
MLSKTSREIIFFCLAFVMFYLFALGGEQFGNKYSIPNCLVFLVVGIIFSIILSSVYYGSKINKCENYGENFWDVSPYALCKGGPYFWQGDSPTSKMCRDFASTPEGRVGISSYNCPVGYAGQPGLPFNYSPLSDDNWENSRCTDLPDCKGVDVGMCSMIKQVP